jgi:hypothetical protein
MACRTVPKESACPLLGFVLCIGSLAKGGEGQPEAVIQKISQETLAEMIGTTRSRVNLFMTKFRKLGFVEHDGVVKETKSVLTVVLRD